MVDPITLHKSHLTERSYMRGLASIYQSDGLADTTTAAISLIKSEVIDYIEVDTSI